LYLRKGIPADCQVQTLRRVVAAVAGRRVETACLAPLPAAEELDVFHQSPELQLTTVAVVVAAASLLARVQTQSVAQVD
jgi:hypothetical protein